MKNRYLPLFAAAASAMFLYCGKADRGPQKPIIAVTIPPQKFFVEKIAGDLFSVLVMVPPGASPHTYEPKPAQMAALAKADHYFTIGTEFEKAWLGRLATTVPRLSITATDSGIDKITVSSEDAHDREGVDPHIWLSPELVKLQAATITRALCASFPEHAVLFKHNDSQFLREIISLQDSIKRTLSGHRDNTTFLVFHPAWGYFAREFGLKEVAIEVDGKEPSPREMTAITDLARAQDVTTIYVQPQFSRRSADIIAREIGATVAEADDLAEVWDANLFHFAKEIGR
jgi:zinc transport system substrate-binding protein